MKIFIQYIKNYFKVDFQILPHVLIGLFLGTCIWINYETGFFEKMKLADVYKWPSVIYFWLFFSFAFISSVLIISISQKKNKPIYNRNFIVFGLIGMLFVALDNSYYIMAYSDSLLPDDPFIAKWVKSCISNLSNLITVIIPLYLIYLGVKYFKPELYGLKLNGARIRSYFWLVLFMLPLIYLASFRPDFLKTYPTYTDHYEYRLLGIDQWITVGIYELCYGFDFLSVELFFRGFMVIALSRFVGKEALLPMVVVYCFLHFGKPAGETISSIFGGYILGILAYSSRNIFGGLVAHLGVAWGMEYLAYLQ